MPEPMDGPKESEGTEVEDYVLGKMPLEKRATFMRHLADHPDELRNSEIFQKQLEMLRQVGLSVTNEPIPARFIKTLDQLKVKPHRRKRWMFTPLRAAFVSASCSLVAGMLLGIWIQGSRYQGSRNPFEQMLSDSNFIFDFYSKSGLSPVEYPAEKGDVFEKMTSSYFGRKIPPVDLKKTDFDFIGGRLVPGNGNPASMFVYEKKGGDRLFVYVWPSKGATDRTLSPWRAREEGEPIYYWVNREIGFAVRGNPSGKDLESIAQSIQDFYQKH